VIEDKGRRFYGVQFHPEVIHTKQGLRVLGNFLFREAGLKPDWTISSFVARKVKEIRAAVGSGRVICGLSGGVDSLVTSLIIHKAIGRRLTCIFIDNGLLRKGQYEALMEAFRHKFALKVVGIDASDLFLEKLRGIVSPERKRKTIGRLFIHLFEREAMRLGGAAFLAQGTIYPDVIESNPVKGPSSVIKSHHNVGGLPKGLRFKLIEPLRELFKDEVRALALELGVDQDFIHQHPFPGPGLAVRMIGAVDRESLEILRAADDIVLQEVQRAGIYNKLWQAFAVLLPVRSVGVMGDQRTYHRVVVVRLVQSSDGMTANWYAAPAKLLARISTRIVNEVRGVNRVVYDVTTKPPGTIEWE
jgi:GMP synthase (glutamine-hydrolysing)